MEKNVRDELAKLARRHRATAIFAHLAPPRFDAAVSCRPRSADEAHRKRHCNNSQLSPSPAAPTTASASPTASAPAKKRRRKSSPRLMRIRRWRVARSRAKNSLLSFRPQGEIFLPPFLTPARKPDYESVSQQTRRLALKQDGKLYVDHRLTSSYLGAGDAGETLRHRKCLARPIAPVPLGPRRAVARNGRRRGVALRSRAADLGSRPQRYFARSGAARTPIASASWANWR